ncbi:MAG: FecR domain-containing protein [Candidatus Aminicenantes bacterium]|nr:FecR domain-containing protein [Candidatus Aminicenantes bacterium]
MRKITAILISLLFTGLCFSAEEETQYTNYTFARLSYVKGKTYIQRVNEMGVEEGQVNMPLAEGDRMGTTDGRAEVYLGRKNYVRLDNNTKIDFLNLPKRGYDHARIRIWAGHVYFDIDFLEKEKNIEIHTSDVSLYVLSEGLYRVDVRENGETEVLVFNGLIEAAGSSGSLLVKDEQRLEISQGRFVSKPNQFFAAAEDSFDKWCQYRSSLVNRRMSTTYLPEELEDFEHELNTYGYWAYVEPYGYVWVPKDVGSDWRPYYNGRWMWMPLCGWTWLPYEPWGWCTFHYGRWHWSPFYNWYWIPSTMWGPGWVSWYWGYGYYGWAPLSWYGYPGVILNNRYYSRYYGRIYPHNSRALTVIHKNNIHSKNISKVALDNKSISKLGKLNLLNSSPASGTNRGTLNLERIGDKRYILRKTEGSNISNNPRTIRNSLETQGRNLTRRNIERSPAAGNTEGGKKTIDAKRAGPENRDRTFIKRGSYGYPSSPDISIKNSARSRNTSSRSFINRINNYLTRRDSIRRSASSLGRSSSYRGRISSSSSRSRSSGSRSSISRSRSSSSRSRSSSSRSSGSRSSGSSRSGARRK